MATIHNMNEATGNATAMTGSAATASSAYDTAHHDAGNPIITKVLVPLVIVVAVSIGGYVAYEIFVNNKSPDQIVPLLYSKGQEVIALFLGTDGGTVAPPPAGGQEVVAVPPSIPVPEVAAPPVEVAEPAPLEVQVDPPIIDEPPPAYGNEQSGEQAQSLSKLTTESSYLELPNTLASKKLQFARAWSMQEEEVWRSGLTHQFAWQQYKAVQDVITMKLAGSDAILWEALNNPRLWTRMKALTGLVKFGANVDSDTVLRALGEERPSLIANYFKRFTIRNDAAQRFIMRYALRMVGPRARLHIIRALVVGADELSDLYLVAATRDLDRRVSRWAEAKLKSKNLPPDVLEKYRNQVGTSSF